MSNPVQSFTVSYGSASSLFPSPSMLIIVLNTFLFPNAGVVINSWVSEIKRSWGSCFSTWALMLLPCPHFSLHVGIAAMSLLVPTCLLCKNVLQQSQDNVGLFILISVVLISPQEHEREIRGLFLFADAWKCLNFSVATVKMSHLLFHLVWNYIIDRLFLNCLRECFFGC